MPRRFALHGCPGEELAQVAGAPPLGREPGADVGLGAARKRAAGGPKVAGERLGGAELFEHLAGAVWAEAAVALRVLVCGRQKGPAQVSGQQQSVGWLEHA